MSHDLLKLLLLRGLCDRPHIYMFDAHCSRDQDKIQFEG